MLNSHTARSSVDRMIASFRCGSVMCQNCLKRLAPSTSAASYRSFETDWRSARIRIAKKGTPRHRSATTAAEKTVEVSDSQLVP